MLYEEATCQRKKRPNNGDKSMRADVDAKGLIAGLGRRLESLEFYTISECHHNLKHLRQILLTSVFETRPTKLC